MAVRLSLWGKGLRFRVKVWVSGSRLRSVGLRFRNSGAGIFYDFYHLSVDLGFRVGGSENGEGGLTDPSTMK